MDVKLDREDIREVLLRHGYREREQPHGAVDLASYVYLAAEELLAIQRKRCARVAAQMNAASVAGALGGTS